MKRKFGLAALAVVVFAGTMGYAAAQDGRYDQDGRSYDRDDYRYQRDYDRDDHHGEFREGLHTARDVGYQDGVQTAREDSWRGKPFNPYPRGRNHADRGYERDFGSLHEYREHYTRAYYDGYSRGYQDQRGGYYR